MFWWHTHQKRRKKGNHRGRLASCCHMNVYCISVSIAGVRQVFYSVFFLKKNICNSHNSLTSCSIERIPKLPESTDSAIFSSTAPQRRRLVERRESEGRKSSTENRTFYLFSFDLLGFFFGVFFSFSCFLCYLLSTECGPCLGLL